MKLTGASLGLPVVDIHTVTATHPEFFGLDGVHPDGDGAHLIAQVVRDELSAEKQ